MSQPAANCPNCGALVRFRWSGAVQTTCEYCRSILVRRDVNLEKVGQVADLPHEVSPIQLGTEGTYRNKAFQVVGRILYEFEEGGWNEWHIVFNDGASGWLSDAQLEYVVSFLSQAPGPLPAEGEIHRARQFNWNGVEYDVTSVTCAHYKGVAGELPFEYWDKRDVTFADLRTADARFGTIDYSDSPPLLFLGEAVEFDGLHLKNLRELDTDAASSKAAVSGLQCPSCGGPLTLNAAGHSLSVVCPQCHAILDAKNPNLQVLEKFEAKQQIKPLIPLGTSGKLDGAEYEVIGFQVRETDTEDVPDSWAEYLLYNRFRGFRYLTEYNGHWNDVRTVPVSPKMIRMGMKPGAIVMGRKYTGFDDDLATTTYVLGEFPWRVHVGEKNRVRDFVAVPQILSGEISENEEVWSLGTYTTGAQVWKAFSLPGQPPPATGIYLNQPAPFGGQVSSMWRVFLNLMSAVILLAILFYVFTGQESVFQKRYGFTPHSKAEASFVTDTFEVKGHPSNVEISINTDLQNAWAYFNLALINEATGQGYDFGREVSYYSGRDSDGAWTEGGRKNSVTIPAVEPGRYYLRVEPEMAQDARSMVYTLDIKRSVPSASFFIIALVLLAVPPVLATWRGAKFEIRRWSQSRYASGHS